MSLPRSTKTYRRCSPFPSEMLTEGGKVSHAKAMGDTGEPIIPLNKLELLCVMVEAFESTDPSRVFPITS